VRHCEEADSWTKCGSGERKDGITPLWWASEECFSVGGGREEGLAEAYSPLLVGGSYAAVGGVYGQLVDKSDPAIYFFRSG